MTLTDLYPDTAECNRFKNKLTSCRTMILKWCRNKPISQNDINEVIGVLVVFYTKTIGNIIGNDDYYNSLQNSLLKSDGSQSLTVKEFCEHDDDAVRNGLRRVCKLLFNWLHNAPFEAVDVFNLIQLLLQVKTRLDNALNIESQHDPDYHY